MNYPIMEEEKANKRNATLRLLAFSSFDINLISIIRLLKIFALFISKGVKKIDKIFF